MGCACKQKYSEIAKYSDDKEPFKKTDFLGKILMFFGRLIMVILIAVLIIIILPLFLVYMLICFLFGKQVIINLKRLTGFLSKHEEENNKEKEILID
jgi:flagellar basal body-associated protein FliL